MTAPVTDFLTPYVEGFARLLAAAGIGLSWQTYGAGGPADAPIFLALMPTDPTVAVMLNPIPLSQHPTLSVADVDLQIRYRAGRDARDVWALRDRVRYVLTGRFPTRLPTGVWVSRLDLAYGTSMGHDDQARRWSWSDLWHTTATDPRR